MKHASASTLRSLEQLLVALRELPALVERRPGIFYRRSAAFLHFHEDPAGLFADVKLQGSDFERLPVNTAEDRSALLRAVKQALEPSEGAEPRMPSGRQFLEVRVKPNAAVSLLRQDASGTWSAHLKSPPVDGLANAELISLVADRFGCGKSAISIKTGSSGRTKLLKIQGT